MTENVSTDVATVDAELVSGDVATVTNVAELSAAEAGVFSTFKGEDFATRVKVFAAVTDAEPLSDHIGEVINLANVVAQNVEVHDDNTDSMVKAARVILVDDEGKAYAAISDGLYRSLQNIFAIVGYPESWDGGVFPIVVKEVKSRKGFRFFTVVPA